MPDISDSILTEATTGIKSATVDGRNVVSRDLKELIEADKYLTGKTAAQTAGTFGVRFFNTSPPGAVSVPPGTFP